MAPLTAVTGRLLLETPCTTDSTVWLLAVPAANTGWLVADTAARTPGGRLMAVPAASALGPGLQTRLAADTAGFLLMASTAVPCTAARVVPAVTAALAVALLTGRTDALTRVLPAGVTAAPAGVLWRLADWAATAVFTRPSAYSAAATGIVFC